MGGTGSGRRSMFDAKDTTESQHRVDIRVLKQQGWFYAGAAGLLSWTCNGEQTGSVQYRIGLDHMMLVYKIRPPGGEWMDVEETVYFDWTPCNFGGCRYWFHCPGCGRRVAVIYGAGRLFLCRHCYGLTYATQQETRPYRLLRRARKLKTRLGIHDPMGRVIVKPKGMHHCTFFEMRMQIARYERLGWAAAARALGLPVDDILGS